tara:strand:- start:1935 stop:2192 length:258 start_codon:yes stop_codon:yes gene_type:complete
MNKQDALKVIKTVKDDLNDYIEDVADHYNELITDLYKQGLDSSEDNEEYSRIMGRLHMILDLKKYVNYDLENYVIGDLEYKKRIQ